MAVKRRPELGDAVLVRWIDAVTEFKGWVHAHEANIDVEAVTTVGILIDDQEASITVALSAGGEAVNGCVTIPAAWIDEIQMLRRDVVK